MSTHTPGPEFIREAAELLGISQVDADYWERLIAAAPRMLEIIRTLVSSPAMVDNDEPMMVEARAILRDVEGEK